MKYRAIELDVRRDLNYNRNWTFCDDNKSGLSDRYDYKIEIAISRFCVADAG